MTNPPDARMTPPGTATRRPARTEVQAYVDRIMWFVTHDHPTLHHECARCGRQTDGDVMFCRRHATTRPRRLTGTRGHMRPNARTTPAPRVIAAAGNYHGS